MNEGKAAASNFLWRLMERCGAQCVSLIVSIILARLLSPDVYGDVALITVFTSILSVFVRCGMASSLVQKKNADNLDFSSVFYFNIATSILLYLLMFFSAPLIARFYNSRELTSVIRVSSLTLLVSGMRNVQEAYISKNMLFKRTFYSTLIATIIAAFCGIFMAYKGYGIWALVTQYLLIEAIGTAILWFTVKWHPILKFSFKRLKSLLSFAWKLLVSTLIDAIYIDIRQLIIGKFYSSADLGYYNKGNQFPALVNTNVNNSIDAILFPTMSKSQDNIERVKDILRRSIKTSTYIMAPLLFGLACVSDKFIELILGEAWLPCVPYLNIFCITYTFYPIHTANLNAIKALGRSDLCLKLEIFRKATATAIIAATLWFGPLVICIGEVITTFCYQIINSVPNKKLLNYSFLQQFRDILPHFALAAVMAITVWLLGTIIKLPLFICLIIQVFAGALIYILGSVILKFESFYYVVNMAKSFLHKK